MGEKARLTLDMEPELHRRVKMMAVRKGLSMRDFCVGAIQDRLALELGKTIGPDPVLEELWDNEDDAVFDEL
jgi:hypothetical protein